MSFFARFAQNRGALVGLFILLAIIAMAMLAPFLYPESPWRMVQRPFLAPME
ncbi:MAG: ABC transporter permease, partial [Billgrantia desiderata]